MIGDVARQMFSEHHIDSINPLDHYRAYVKENSRELLVEPPIQVTFHGGDPSKDDDVCEYKIVPTIQKNGGRSEDNEATHHQQRSKESDYEEDEEDYEDDDNQIPFSIRPSKESKHEAVLEVSGHLNCEHRSSYLFDILAVSCSGGLSSR